VGATLSTFIQTSPRAHPTTYKNGTESFPGVKRTGHGINHAPPFSTEVKETVQLYLYSPSVPSWYVRE
jgi:hypothetical protein